LLKGYPVAKKIDAPKRKRRISAAERAENVAYSRAHAERQKADGWVRLTLKVRHDEVDSFKQLAARQAAAFQSTQPAAAPPLGYAPSLVLQPAPPVAQKPKRATQAAKAGARAHGRCNPATQLELGL
jgi:hypothetical protein